MTKVMVIGHGTIGKRIVQQLPHYGYEPAIVVTSTGIKTTKDGGFEPFPEHESRIGRQREAVRVAKQAGIRYALIAIPSGKDGVIESYYMQDLITAGIQVVTAGKSALANEFSDLERYLPRIGFDATVGGGTMIPSFIRSHLYPDPDKPFKLTLVINGTLNFAQTRRNEGASPQQICDEAVRLGMTEPLGNGAVPTPLQMYRGEFGDIQRKIAILFNTCLGDLPGRVVTQDNFKATPFEESDMCSVMRGNGSWRYVVQICSRQSDIDLFDDCIPGALIRATVGNVSAAGGFVRLGGALAKWMPDGVGNAACLEQGGDIDIRIGQGAGPVPTVGAMMMNLKQLSAASAQ